MTWRSRRIPALALLSLLTPTFTLVDWIYLSQHLLVLGIALTRRPPTAQDRSVPSSIAVIVAYAYPYAQMAYLRWVPGDAAWPAGGLVLVTLAACLIVASLVNLGRWFGIRPALRGLAVTGPYRFVRHPMYLSYVLADIGYNLEEFRHGAARDGGMGRHGLPAFVPRSGCCLEMTDGRAIAAWCATVFFPAYGRCRLADDARSLWGETNE